MCDSSLIWTGKMRVVVSCTKGVDKHKWDRTTRSIATYFWQNTCSPSLSYLPFLSSPHIQNCVKRGWESVELHKKRYLENDIRTFTWTSRMTGNRNCCSPQWPDCIIVQDTNLMHPAPTVHTFNKPEKRDRHEDTNYTLESLKMVWSSFQMLRFDI